MVRYILLFKYTEIGISQIHGTLTRTQYFRDAIAKLGVQLESQYWTLGEYDGVLTLVAEEEASIVTAATHLARQGYVRTCLMRAYSETEFGSILANMPTPIHANDE